METSSASGTTPQAFPTTKAVTISFEYEYVTRYVLSGAFDKMPLSFSVRKII